MKSMMPSLKEVARSAIEKETGGHASADEEERDVSDDMKALATELRLHGPSSPRAEQILARMQEHGVSRQEAINAAGRAYGQTGDEATPLKTVPIRIVRGQIVLPAGSTRTNPGSRGKASPRGAADRSGAPAEAKPTKRGTTDRRGAPAEAKPAPRGARGQAKPTARGPVTRGGR